MKPFLIKRFRVPSLSYNYAFNTYRETTIILHKETVALDLQSYRTTHTVNGNWQPVELSKNEICCSSRVPEQKYLRVHDPKIARTLELQHISFLGDSTSCRFPLTVCVALCFLLTLDYMTDF